MPSRQPPAAVVPPPAADGATWESKSRGFIALNVDKKGMMQGIGAAPQGADQVRALQDLAQMLQDSQSMAMQMSEKLLKVSVQQSIQDASVGTAVDVTA